jgi:short-subunit dehydrogenase
VTEPEPAPGVLITGAAGPLGTAVARAFAAAGYHVHLADRNEGPIEDLASALRADHQATVEVHAVDLTERVSIEALALECEPLDVLVAAQGAVPAGGLGRAAGDEVADGFALKVVATLLLVREVLETMADGDGGLILVPLEPVASEAVSPYVAAANAALAEFSRESGVRVVAVHPPADTARAADALVRLATEGNAGGTAPNA